MCSICIKVIHIAYNYTFYISVHHLCVCVTKIDTASPSFQHLQRLKVAISGGVVSRCGRNSRVPSDHRLPPTYLYNTIHIPTHIADKMLVLYLQRDYEYYTITFKFDIQI